MTKPAPPDPKSAAQLDLSAFVAAKAEMHQDLIAWQKSPTDQPFAHGFAVIGPVNGEAFFFHESGQEFCLRTGESTFEEAINLVSGQIMHFSHTGIQAPEPVQQTTAECITRKSTTDSECRAPPPPPPCSFRGFRSYPSFARPGGGIGGGDQRFGGAAWFCRQFEGIQRSFHR